MKLEEQIKECKTSDQLNKLKQRIFNIMTEDLDRFQKLQRLYSKQIGIIDGKSNNQIRTNKNTNL